MKLLSISLTNFQGVRNAAFELGGEDATIYGANGTGKTTIANAATWLLFGNASTGAKGFDPKTKGPNGDLHNLEHRVSARIQAEDGRVVMLTKVFHEVYKKKRGSAESEFSGNTIDYAVDGIPAKEKEYAEAVSGFFGGDEELMKLLSTPSYFPDRMDWQRRRSLLLQLCGDISDEDVMESSDELNDLSEFLKIPGVEGRSYTVEEYRKIAAARKTEINKRLEAIPGRIDEAERAVPDVHGRGEEEAREKLDALLRELEGPCKERQRVLSDSSDAVNRQIATEIKARMVDAKLRYASEESEKNKGVYLEIQDAKKELEQVRDDIRDAERAISSTKLQIKQMRQLRETLMVQYKEAKSSAWDESAGVCPTCHRPLPEEDVQRLREEFNLKKSQRLEEINRRGHEEADKGAIAKLEAEFSAAERMLSKKKDEEREIQEKIKALDDKISPVSSFESTEAYKGFLSELEALEKNKNGAEAARAELLKPLEEHISKLEAEIDEQKRLLMSITLAKSQKERIAELEAEEKALAAEYEAVEHGIYLCEQFVRAKVSMLTERINERFQNVRFQLFQEQINGGVKECCEVLIPSPSGSMVPYPVANNAARINAGLEIIDVVSKHFGVSLPVFVDNAESVTSLIQIAAQVIRLVVSERDEKLRLVTDVVREGAA